MDGNIETRAHALTIERVFKAPPALLFKVWTDPAHMANWMGCGHMTSIEASNDLRVGGAFRIDMTLEGGAAHVISGTYHEIDERRRLVFSWSWRGEGGFAGDDTLVTLTFEPEGEATRMTLHHALFENRDDRDSHNEGWSASVERMAEYLLAGAGGAA